MKIAKGTRKVLSKILFGPDNGTRIQIEGGPVALVFVRSAAKVSGTAWQSHHVVPVQG